MNFATALPRFAQLGFLSRTARQPRPVVLMPQQQALARHATLRLENRSLELRVLRGCVWITRDGCAKDVVLEVGEAFGQRPGAPVLVTALDDAEILLVKPAANAQNS